MTPDALAALHARCFDTPRPYSAAEFAGFLASDHCFLIADSAGFLVGRTVADEAEIVTLAVDPDRRRQGTGARLLADFEAEASRRGARRAYLEVAAGNAAALALYRRAGFAEEAVRKSYYRHADGTAEDAVLLSKVLSSP